VELRAVIALALALSGTPALARPTDGGLFGFDPDDEVVHFDDPGGRVRVHYAIAGPSVTLLDDGDGDGVPDFPQRVGAAVDLAWSIYEDTGFRGPRREADLGLPALGGSAAFDVYLVDFGGGSDGAFRVDGCDARSCAGHLLIENDFAGYGYPSLDAAIVTLASHELFHGVQYAYRRELPVWFSEGTAVWAQRHVDPGNGDFVRYAQAYLDDAGRSLDVPPVGPVPVFAYATGLWFDFLSLRHGDAAIVALMELVAGDPLDPVGAIGAVLARNGDAWPDAWMRFAAWNAATGPLAGGAEGYPYAARLRRGVTFAHQGARVEEIRRFFPLATTYYRVEHAEGPLRIAIEACDDRVRFAVYPVGSDGALGAAVAEQAGPELWLRSEGGGGLPAGSYVVVVSLPEPADQSARTAICAGSERWCGVVPSCGDGGDDIEEPEPAGCGRCDGGAGGAPGWLALVAVPALMSRRRRRSGLRGRAP
jgi:hypothetical protein